MQSYLDLVHRKVVRVVVILLALLVQFFMTLFVLTHGIWPVKNELLVGEKYVGRISKEIDPSIPIHKNEGYDSQFFWAISLDPFMRNQKVIESLDSPSYRYQRIFFPFLAWLFSFGNVLWIPYSLFFVGVIAWLIGFFAMWNIVKELNISPLLPLLFFIFNAGMIFSLFHPLADLMASSLTMLAFLFWLKNKLILSGLLFACASLTKETTILVPVAIIFFNLLNHKTIFDKKNVILFLSIFPFLLWYIWIKYKLGMWAFIQSHGNFDWPYLAIYKLLGTKNIHVIPNFLSHFLAAGGMGLLYLYSIVKICLPRNLIEAVAYVQAIFLSFSGVAILEHINSSSRASIPFFLFFSLWIALEYREKTSTDQKNNTIDIK